MSGAPGRWRRDLLPAGRRAAEEAAWLAAVHALAGAAAAGAPPTAALRTAAAATGASSGSARCTLLAASRAAAFGADPSAVLHRAAAPGPRGGGPQGLAAAAARGLADSLRLSRAAGAPLIVPLAALDTTLTAQRAAAREVDAALAAPRSSARILAALPLAGVGLAAVLGAHPLGTLLGTAAGRCCLLIGALLDLAGLVWLRRLAAAVAPGPTRPAPGAPPGRSGPGPGLPRGSWPAAAAVLLIGGALGAPGPATAAAAGVLLFGTQRQRRAAGPRPAGVAVPAPLALAADYELLAAAVAAGTGLAAAAAVLSRSADPGSAAAWARVSRAAAAGDPHPLAWLAPPAVTRPARRQRPGCGAGRWAGRATGGRDAGQAEQWAATAVTAVLAAQRAGAALAPTLRREAAALRADAVADAVVRARSLGARAVLPLTLCFLPAFAAVGVAPVLLGSLPGVLSGR